MVPTTKNGLIRLSVSRRNAGPLGKRHKFRQGYDLHFLHHSPAMGFDGSLVQPKAVPINDQSAGLCHQGAAAYIGQDCRRYPWQLTCAARGRC